MTDLLQLMDIAVNKPAKDFLKWKFEHLYSDKVMSQLQGVSDIESAEIQSIDLSMAVVKELSVHWLVEMAEYIADTHNSSWVVSIVLALQVLLMASTMWFMMMLTRSPTYFQKMNIKLMKTL